MGWDVHMLIYLLLGERRGGWLRDCITGERRRRVITCNINTIYLCFI